MKFYIIHSCAAAVVDYNKYISSSSPGSLLTCSSTSQGLLLWSQAWMRMNLAKPLILAVNMEEG